VHGDVAASEGFEDAEGVEGRVGAGGVAVQGAEA